jgi:hypothetical protein
MHSGYYMAVGVRKYKPIDRKVRPVPTYMPNPSAQKFKPLALPSSDPLPHHSPPLQKFSPMECLTLEHLEQILSTISDGFLSSQEQDLLAFVVIRRQNAIVFTDGERGIFSREYFPDYEIPVIEHIP